ncbi:site-2 protease family protein [archaeon]|jgi:membrane-associated protease RseP (regulator of RpoE activity)|nr:site-2 protease family protein [archaeon]MBT4271979.1 site-2 protease family protein [archaeon]MBT5424053.1 site-2 protease family protein [archaeon]
MISFLILKEYQWTLLFYSAIMLIIYLNKEKLTQEGIAFLLRTKLGLNLMDKISSKHRKFVKFIGYIAIVFAYLGFFVFLYLLYPMVRDTLLGTNDLPGAGPAVPGFEIAGTGIKIPLIIGWIALLVIMIVHEFSHGVVARAHKQKVRSSGVGVVGPFPVAFVELDEETIAKQPHKIQHSIFAAGPFSNILLFLVCLGLMFGAIQLDGMITKNHGVLINPIMNETLPAYAAGLSEGSIVTNVNGEEIFILKDLEIVLDKLKPGDDANLTLDSGEFFSIKTISNPTNHSRAYVGIWILGNNIIVPNNNHKILHSILIWLIELFWWTWFLSINIGLFNLFPIFITDGARMLKLNIDYLVKDKKKSNYIWMFINYLGLLVLFILLWNFLSGVIMSIFSIFF